MLVFLEDEGEAEQKAFFYECGAPLFYFSNDCTIHGGVRQVPLLVSVDRVLPQLLLLLRNIIVATNVPWCSICKQNFVL